MEQYPYIDTLKGAPAFLEVSSGPLCGRFGLKILGLRFTSKPILLEVKNLEPGVAEDLARHPDLIVVQHAKKPKQARKSDKTAEE